MKKALLVTRVSGFVPQHEMNNVKILQEMGYEIHYATNLNRVVYGEDNSRLYGTGIITHQIDFQKSPFSRDLNRACYQLQQLMLKEPFDLIHCHMPLSAAVTRIAAQKVSKQTKRQIPVLYTAHGLHFYTGAPLRNWIYYPVEWYLSRYTDCLILINQEDYQRGKHFPIRGKVEYVPGIGIPLDGYKPVVLWDDSMAGKYQKHKVIEKLIGRTIAPTTKVLIDIGELSRRKNHGLLVEMMAELKDLDLICIIGGTGAEKANLQKLIHKRGLEDCVFLTGYVNNVKQLLAESDCLVFPSYQEGLPVAMMEAMAAGIPIVASRIRGVTDLLLHGKGGYLVSGFNPSEYAGKVRRLFVEEYGHSAMPRNLRRYQMGKWNQERIQLFSREVVDKRMRTIYDSLGGNNHGAE